MASAHAQMTPTGTFVPGHTIRCLNNTCTVVGDAGPALGSSTSGSKYLTEIGITATGTPFCINDALTSGPYHQLCFGALALGGGLISYNPYKGATALGLTVNLNGSNYAFPGAGNGNVVGPVTTVVGDIPLWNDTNGSAQSDSGVLLTSLAPLASPAFTGVPTAPTAAAGTNTTQLATTAFVQAGTPSLNVKSCGATGNGATDDSAAINTCITSLSSSGGVLFFPAGTYSACSTLVIPTKVVLEGASRKASIIEACATGSNDLVRTTNFSSLTGGNTAAGPYEFGFKHMTFNGNKAGRSGGNCISIYGYDYLVDDVEIINCYAVGLYSEWSTSTTVPVAGGGLSMEAHLINMKVAQNGGNGITWYGPHDSRMVDVLTFLNGNFGLNVDNSAVHSGGGTMFSNFHSYGNTSTGVANNANIFVDGFESESNGGEGIDCTGTTYGFIQGSDVSAFSNTNIGINIHSGCAATLSAVQVYANGSTGVQISNGSSIGELFTYSNTGDGVAVGTGEVTLSGVRAENNTVTGVALANGIGDVVITGKASGNATQIDLGTGLTNTASINLTAFNTGGGQTSYAGSGYSMSAFLAILTGGSGALSSLFVHP